MREKLGLYFTNPIFRGLAQLVERAVWDREAEGSSPLSPTNKKGVS
jgi:hypothetical protein